MPYKDAAKQKICHATWAERNKDKSRGYARKWREKNRSAVKAAAKRRRAGEGPQRHMLWHAKRRTKNKGIPFSITLDDIFIPLLCPVFRTPLRVNARTVGDNSPTLDCVIPELGYTPKNSRVISHLANRLKSTLTEKQLQAILAYIKDSTK